VLHVQWNAEAPISFGILDLTGRSIRPITSAWDGGDTVIDIPVNGLANGTYRLMATMADGRSWTLPFVVQH
jgi:hypothetical protein